MTVILAKFQALLFQSGIGLKIVNLRVDNKGDIATVEFSEFNLGGISEQFEQIDRQLPESQNI